MNRILSALMIPILLSIPSHAFAQGDEPPIPSKPKEGVYILDALDWLTPAQESAINIIAGNLDAGEIAQLAVVTWDDCGSDRQAFRKDIFDSWEIGHKNDQDGLLILVCWYGGDDSRRSVEQVTGPGIVKTLPDALTSRIAKEYFIPAFEKGATGDGLLAMVQAYDDILRDGGQTLKSPSSSNIFFVIVMLGTLPGILLSTLYVNIRSSGNKLVTRKINGKKRIAYKNEWMGIILPEIKQAALAEIISLVVILLTLFFNKEGIVTLPLTMQFYAESVLSYLLYWGGILFVFLVSPYVRGKDRESGWWQSGGDSSSGGDSGGGSSTNF